MTLGNSFEFISFLATPLPPPLNLKAFGGQSFGEECFSVHFVLTYTVYSAHYAYRSFSFPSKLHVHRADLF